MGARPPPDALHHPGPGLAVPSLSAGRDGAERGQVVAVQQPVGLPPQHAREGGCGAEVRDAVAFDQPPHPPRVREGGRAFGDHQRCTGQQGTEDGDGAAEPAEVGRPEQAVAGLDVERQPRVLADLDAEAAMRMNRALGRAGGAGGVHQQHRLLRRQLPRRRGLSRAGDQRVPPDVARRGHRHVQTGVPQHHHVPDAVVAAQSRVDHRLHGHHPAAAPRAVGGDEGAGAAQRQALRHRVRAEAGEQRQGDAAEPRARHEGGHGLRQHRQVETDHVAGPEAQARAALRPGRRPRGPARRSCAPARRRPRLPRSPPAGLGSCFQRRGHRAVVEVRRAAETPARMRDAAARIQHAIRRAAEAETAAIPPAPASTTPGRRRRAPPARRSRAGRNAATKRVQLASRRTASEGRQAMSVSCMADLPEFHGAGAAGSRQGRLRAVASAERTKSGMPTAVPKSAHALRVSARAGWAATGSHHQALGGDARPPCYARGGSWTHSGAQAAASPIASAPARPSGIVHAALFRRDGKAAKDFTPRRRCVRDQPLQQRATAFLRLRADRGEALARDRTVAQRLRRRHAVRGATWIVLPAARRGGFAPDRGRFRVKRDSA